MNKKFLVAALGLAFAQLAQAQSSVVLYGRLDQALQLTNSPNGRVSNLTGSESGTRWGLRGTEALYGNLSAHFNLESGFDVSNGQLIGSGLFNRIAIVGLSGNFGTVDLGLKDSPMFNVLDMADPFGSSYTSSPNFMLWAASNNGRGYARRYSNQLSYTTPDFGGFSVQGMYSLGENNTTRNYPKTLNDVFGLSAIYKSGPLYLGAAYNRSRDAGGSATTTTIPIFSYVNSTSQHKYKVAAGSFDFTAVKLYGAYYTDKRDQINASVLVPGQATIDQRVYWVGLSAPLSQLNTIAFTVGRVNDKTAPNRDARQFGAGFFHDLSKRTTLYTTYGNIKNDNVVFGSGIVATGSTGFSTGGSVGTLNNSGKASSFDFGVVHRF